jgi:hypothetical protein
MMLVLAVLFTPFCATIAGFVVWVSHRHESLGDGALLRSFLVLLFISMALLWSVGRTSAVRMRLDPQLRVQAEIEAHPVYATLERLAPDDAKALRAFLGLQMSRGQTLSAAFLQARPLLTHSVTERLGFANQDSRLMWGRLVVDTLGELRARDPVLCYRALAGQELDQQALGQAFSPANTAAFQRAVVRIYESADRGMRRERSPADEPVTFNQAALEFRVVQDEVEHRFGPEVAAQIAHGKFTDPAAAPPQQLCAARIFQLEAMLKRPKGTASMLVDSVLR